MAVCSAEQSNFGRVHYEEQHYEFISIWPVVQEEMSFKRFIIWSSGSPCV